MHNNTHNSVKFRRALKAPQNRHCYGVDVAHICNDDIAEMEGGSSEVETRDN